MHKHFFKSSRRHKYSTDTLNISYICTRDLTQPRKQVINITNKSLAQIKRPCNRRANNICPLNINCLQSYIIYKTTVDTVDHEEETNIGVN